MPDVNKIPEKTITFNVYKDSATLLGVATVELPQLQAMTDTLSGAGILGEIDSPTLGHFQSMSVKLNFRTKTQNYMLLTIPEEHQLDLRSAIQHKDGGTGALTVVSERYVLRCMPKSAGLGKLEPSKPQDCDIELEVSYIKHVLDGKELLELDKLNYIFKINDKDYMEPVRKALGQE